MSWDEDISSSEAVNKVNGRAQAKSNGGISPLLPFLEILNIPYLGPALNGGSPTTISPSTGTPQ